VERDIRVLLHIEEIFTLQFIVFHPVSCLDSVRLNLDIQHPRRCIRRLKGQRGIPLIELIFNSNGCFDVELNRLSTGVTLKAGTPSVLWARPTDGTKTEAMTQTQSIAL